VRACVLVREVYLMVYLWVYLFRQIRLLHLGGITRGYRVSRVCSLYSTYTYYRYHSLWRMADYMVIMVDIATSLPGSWSHAAIAARSATPTAGLERRSRVPPRQPHPCPPG